MIYILSLIHIYFFEDSNQYAIHFFDDNPRKILHFSEDSKEHLYRTQKVDTVSYTHLDVYKRQCLFCLVSPSIQRAGVPWVAILPRLPVLTSLCRVLRGRCRG